MNGSRDNRLVCPACAALLEPASVGGAIIDVCPACAGIWADWFDGELTRVAGGTHLSSSVAIASGGSLACPRCQKPLAGEGFLETGATLLRCEDCSGAFVPRAAMAVLVNAQYAAASAEGEENGLAKLVVLLRRWLGRGD